MSRYRFAAPMILFAVVACEPREPVRQPVAAPSAEVAGVIEEPERAGAGILPMMEQACVNREEGYSVRYPATWHVNNGTTLDPCSLFDPEPIQAPENSQIPPSIAVMIEIEPVAFAAVTGEVLGRHETVREFSSVDGRSAVQMDAVSTGHGLYDRGMKSYSYFIDLDGTTMIASTHDVGDLPFERKRRILDAMMETVRFGRAD